MTLTVQENTLIERAVGATRQRRIAAALIGASAGSIDALRVILPGLEPGAGFAVLLVIHLSPEAPNLVPELLSEICRLPVTEAESAEPIEPGHIYMAPPDYHMTVEADHTLSLSTEPPVNYSRPSVDVLFESAAEVYGARSLGIILSGANADGARGLRTVKRRGGITLVEDPESAQFPDMPRAAVITAAPDFVFRLDMIAGFLGQLTKENASHSGRNEPCSR